MAKGRRIAGLVLAALLFCGLAPAGAQAAQPDQGGEATVLFTHDLHSCFFPRAQEGGGELGGFARLSAALQEERADHPDALTVDGGDFSSGSLIQTLSVTRAPSCAPWGRWGMT